MRFKWRYKVIRTRKSIDLEESGATIRERMEALGWVCVHGFIEVGEAAFLFRKASRK